MSKNEKHNRWERLKKQMRASYAKNFIRLSAQRIEDDRHTEEFREWARAEGLPEFTFYAARHSWATVARSSDAGVPYPVVEDCLNHKAAGLLDIYAERDWRTLDDANARVLALFEWPTE